MLIIHISSRKFTRVLLSITVLLALAHIIVRSSVHYFGYIDNIGICDKFDMFLEANVPTYYSSILLLLCCILLAIIAFFKKLGSDQYHKQWTLLSVIFLYLSIDETAMIHEMAGEVFVKLTHGSIPYIHWIIPASVVVITFIIYYIKFLRSLPRWVYLWFIASGAVYIGAALILEMIDGFIWQIYGARTILHAFEVVTEESLEMVGSIMFAYTLMRYIAAYIGKFTIQISDAKAVVHLK